MRILCRNLFRNMKAAAAKVMQKYEGMASQSFYKDKTRKTKSKSFIIRRDIT